MAKSFKAQRPATPTPEPVKPISERDFFDLTDEPLARPAEASRLPASEPTGNTRNTRSSAEHTDSLPNGDHTGTGGIISNKENTGNTDNSAHTDNSSSTGNSAHNSKKDITSNPKNTGKNKSGSNTDNSDNASTPGKTENTGNGSKPDNRETLGLPVEAEHRAGRDRAAGEAAVDNPAAAEDRDVRQTFVLGSSHLDRLRDYVHARRAGGDYEYSQKQALQEALELLFGSVAPVPPRPAQARASEQRRSERIRRGRTQ